jgi:putative transposase
VGVRVRYLLLDRGFWSVNVIRYLQAARRPFLMPVPCRGRKADHLQGPGGTRVFHLRRKSGWDRYTLTNEQGRRATVSICVKCRNRRGERQQHGRQALVYAFWGLVPTSYQWVKETSPAKVPFRHRRGAWLRSSAAVPKLIPSLHL